MAQKLDSAQITSWLSWEMQSSEAINSRPSQPMELDIGFLTYTKYS